MIRYVMNTNNDVYPKISVFDCIVEHIEVINNNLVIKFNRYGVWVKEDYVDNYHRIKNVKLELVNCNLDNSSIVISKPQKIMFRRYQIEESLDFDDLFEKINSGMWSLEIIQEYNYEMGGMYLCSLKGKKTALNCYMQIEFKRKEYIIEENLA